MAFSKSASMLAPTMLLLVTTPSVADGAHEQARMLYEQGEIRGLGEVLRRAQETVPGDVVAVDLVREGGVWVYRLDIVAPDGHRRTITFRASSDSDDGPGKVTADGTTATEGAGQ